MRTIPVSVMLAALVGATLGALACAPAAAPAAPAPAPAARASAEQPVVAAGVGAVAATPTGPAPLRPIRVGIPAKSLSHLPAHVADELGLFREEGLDPEFVRIAGDLAVAGLLTGELGYVAYAGPVMAAIVNGAPLRMIHYQTVKMQHVLIARPETTSIADLAGKRFGIQRFGSLTSFESTWLAQRYDLGEITLLQVGADMERLQALMAGNVDATFMPQPWDLRAEREGLRRLLNMGDVMDVAQVGLATNTAHLRQAPDEVRRLLRATNRGTRVVQDAARRDDVGAIIARWLEIPHDEGLRAVDGTRHSFAASGVPTDAQLVGYLDLLKGTDSLPPHATVADMVDFTLAREVAREMGLPPGS